MNVSWVKSFRGIRGKSDRKGTNNYKHKRLKFYRTYITTRCVSFPIKLKWQNISKIVCNGFSLCKYRLSTYNQIVHQWNFSKSYFLRIGITYFRRESKVLGFGLKSWFSVVVDRIKPNAQRKMGGRITLRKGPVTRRNRFIKHCTRS